MAKIILFFIFSMYLTSIRAHPAQIDDNDVDVKSTLTPSQREQLEKFREAVADLLEDDYERSDEYLLGYLQSKQWKIFSATQMLKIAKNWKKIHEIDELSKSNFSSEMLTRFPVRLGGFDKNGCPVTELDFGQWDLAGYILNQEFVRDGVKNVVKHVRQYLAKVELGNRNSFPKCHQTREIISIKNYNSSHISEVNSITACVKLTNDYVNYFPNAIFAADMVDVPDSFQPILELIKTSVSDEVYRIIKIHNGGSENWKQKLDDIVDVDQRSRLYAGTA